MSKVKQLPSGSYRCQVYLGKDETGKRKFASVTAPTKTQAELKAAQLKNERKSAQFHSMTVSEAVSRYITAKTPVLSPPTIRAYKSMQRAHFDVIGQKKVFLLTSEDMQLFVSDLTGKVSAKTVANVYNLLASSVALFRPDVVFRVTLPRRKKERRVSPSDSVVQALFDTADTEMKKCIALSAFGSLRRGEICALKHQDVNGLVVTVHADMVHTDQGDWFYKEMPKTSDSFRAVVLPEAVVDLLGDGLDDDFIISLNPNAITSRFMRLRDRLGLKGVRFHDMRHYFASIGAVLGIPDTYLSQFGGWRPDSAVLRNTYKNVIASEAQKYSDRMTQHFNGILLSDNISTRNSTRI